MRWRYFASLLMLFTACTYAADPRDPLLPNYGTGILETAGSAGTYSGALGAYWNPAGWAAMHKGEIAFTWDDRNAEQKRLDNWAALIGGHGLGAAMRRSISDTLSHHALDEFQLGLAGGGRRDYWGVAYGWAKGEDAAELRQHYLTLGSLYRPNKFISVGGTGTLGLRNGRTQLQADLGLRPLWGSHRVTLFGDVAAHDKDNPRTLQWGGGIELMPVDGIRLSAKISKVLPDDPAPWLTIGAGFSLDQTGVHIAPHYDKDSERTYTSYVVRVGNAEPSFPADKWINRDEKVVAKNLRGTLTYQKALLFDADKHTLVETLEWIEQARKDVSVHGIALNLSGFHSNLELVWELGQKLDEFRATGKQVYMYTDNPTMLHTYLMAHADHVWMDQYGMLEVGGWVMGKTYHKGMFEKLGIGVEEWRFFDYKSAFEMFARKNMSEKDREQRQALLDEFHAEWQNDVCAGLGLSADTLKLLMDSLALITPQEAMRFGIVDTLGRWDDAPDLVEFWTGDGKDFSDPDDLTEDEYADPQWGEYPQIAVVYALGECDLDTGIRGRYTSRLLRKLAKDPDVDGVVLRVDSPGGDGMASDWVAEQMRAVSDEKPMIVSQGRVAASGGYWLSSPADHVFTSPFTITGSIGVIGGWLWNDGLTDKTGLTFDKVQIGKWADLGSGITLPLVNIQVPDRPVTAEEHARIERMIRTFYDEFVGMVAEDRGLQRAEVEAIAQGRVWGGRAALERKLVDEIGGLDQAIAHAKDKAGLARRTKIEIVEYPRPSFLPFDRMFASASPLSMLGHRLGLITPAQLPANDDAPYEWRVIEAYAKRPGQPLFMLPPEDMFEE